MKRTAAILLLTAAAGSSAFAQRGLVPWVERKNPRPDLLQKVSFEQHLNTQVPLNIVFHDEHGRNVLLGDYFGKKPVVLSLVYYECPMLCTVALNGQLRVYRSLKQSIGEDFEVVTVSINPKETPALANAKKAVYLDKYRRASAEHGWHFLTGPESSIRALTQAVGFHYEYDPVSKQYAHTTGLVVLTPEGRIARYQFGVEYSARDLRLSLLQASSNKIGTPVEAFLLYCFHYDPATGKYSVAIINFVRLGAILTFVGLFTFIVITSRKHRAVALVRRANR